MCLRVRADALACVSVCSQVREEMCLRCEMTLFACVCQRGDAFACVREEMCFACRGDDIVFACVRADDRQ